MWQVATHHRNEENPEVLGRFLGRLQEQDPSNGQLDGPEVKLIQDGLHQAFDQSLGQWWGDSWGYPRDSGLIFWTAWVQGFIFQTKPSSYIIGVEKKHDCPRKDEIVRCVRNHKPGFCSQISGARKPTEINSRDKRQGCRCPENKSSILKHVDPFLGNSTQRGMRLSTKLRSFL